MALKTEQIRNVGLLSHGGAGKTSLLESLLYTAKVLPRMGRVEEGNTASDFTPEEIERKNSVSAALAQFSWGEAKINLIDTPGYADFIGEVISSIRVIDSALILINATGGVEVGADQAFRLLEKSQVPRAFVITKLDRENTSFEKVLAELRERYGTGVLPLVLPIGDGLDFKGVVDVLSRKAYTYTRGTPESVKEIPIPADLMDAVESAHGGIIESAAETDDVLVEKYFDQGTLSNEEVNAGLRSGILAGTIFPLFIACGTDPIGAEILLNYIAGFFPTPSAKGQFTALMENGETVSRNVSATDPTSLFIFKTYSEQHVGDINFFRVMSGTIHPGEDLANPGKGGERFTALFSCVGKDRKDQTEIVAGDLGATVKLKDTATGDTLCDKKMVFHLPPMDYPEPVLALAVQLKSKGEEDKLSTALQKLHVVDPTFRAYFDPDIKQTIVAGQGELHLDLTTKKLRERYGVSVDLLEPRIPYRETIKGRSDVNYRHKKQSGGRGQYGDVYLRFEPKPRGEGFEFVDAIVGGVIPGKFIPAVEKGLNEALESGPLAGCKVVDVRIELYFGSFHAVDSSEMAFKIAARQGFKKGFLEASPVLLEPIYNIEVMVPEQFFGAITGDLSSRRGRIMGMDAEGRFQKIRAQAPLAELVRYSTILRSLTQGQGIFTRIFSHYEEMPRELAQKVMDLYKPREDEDE